MKKSLLALAVLGAFAGAASAQSSVTIYGSLDQSLAKANGGTAVNQGAPAGEAWTVQQSHQSRLGFLGNEDLGGGLSAQFQFEHRFAPDTGGQVGAVMWQGRSYVQLSSTTMGKVYLGRDYAPAFWPAVKSDPFGWDGVGQMGVDMYAGYLNSSGVRQNNNIGYKSPSFSGFTVQAATSLGEAVASREDGFNVEYGAGPIYAALGYERMTGGPVTSDGNSFFDLALHYDLGMVKPMFYYARAKTSNGLKGGVLSNTYWMLGATAPVGPGKLKVAYGRDSFEVPAASDHKRQKFGIGYEYFLSKRTDIYFDVGAAREDTLSNNNAYALGIRHDF